MTTKMNNNNQTMMHMCYHLTKKNNKATRVNMRMIKNENRKNETFNFIKITTYHFEEEASERSDTRKSGFSSK